MNQPADLRDFGLRDDPIAATPSTRRAGSGVGPIVAGAAAREAATGDGVAKAFDPVHEQAYWREHYGDRPYIETGASFDDYGPAYRFGANALGLHPGRSFEEVEAELAAAWPAARGPSRLAWEQARPAACDAWHRAGASS